MFDLSPVQIVILLAVVLIIFGPRRLPELGRGLGAGIRDFRRGLSGHDPEPPGPPAADPSRGEDSARISAAD